MIFRAVMPRCSACVAVGVQELALDDLAACEVETVDAWMETAAGALETDGLAAEISPRAENLDGERVAVGVREQIDAVRELVAELQVDLAVRDGGVESRRTVGRG